MNRARATARTLILLLLVLTAPLAAAQVDAETAELPVTRVVLFTTGVGYFEHAGTVVGDQEVELRVATEHMDDLLQSLVLADLDGGSVRPVRYGARDPLGRVLGSFALDLSGDPTFAQLLGQARGEALRVDTDVVLEGTLVNVERTTTGEGDARTLLTLATADGLRRVALEEVRTLRFENAALRAELDAALASIARARDAETQTVTLRFEGTGERRVRIGYVREMPVWKATYRLVLGEAGRADLQGWAIFDNPTHLDLVDVEVVLIAGRPVSFVSALFEPVYAPRARVEAAVAEALAPEADGASFDAAELRGALAPAPMAMESAAADFAASGGGVAAMADGAATGATFAYRVREPVSVGRFESVLMPILTADVEAPRASFHDGTAGRSPLRAVRLVNDTGLHLAAGPVALFDAGGFVGNALLGDVPAGDERWLSHAVDLGLEVTAATSGEPEALVSVLLRGGIVETAHRLRLRTTVRVSNADDARFLIVELPRRTGYDVVAPTPAPAETADALRFGVALAGAEGDATVPTHVECPTGDEVCTFEVVFERVEQRTVALGFTDPQQVRLYLQNAELSADDRAVFERYLDLQGQLVALERAATDARTRLDAVFRDQERVRQNMAALERNSALYRRYLADLETQEDEVDALEVRLADLADERRSVREAVDALVAGLGD
ncbi:MAG: hypothetical protein ABR510_06670 [Trueperaceae bacterium]